MLRSKYDGAEVITIKKVQRNIFDPSHGFGMFRAFSTLEQKVVFYYKKWSKTLLVVGTYLPCVLALVGA